MARRVLCVKGVLVCAVVVGLSVWVGSPMAFGDTASEIEQAKANTISLLTGGDISGADAALDGILAQPDSEVKGQAIQQIAAAYKVAKQYSKAVSLSELVLDKWADADFAVWAQMEIALCNIEAGSDTAADGAVDKLSTDYAEDANLPWTLYLVGEDYRWAGKYDKAKGVYQKIISEHSQSSFAEKARLATARGDVLSAIGNGDYSFGSASAEKMAAEFGGNPDLPESLYQIAQQYVWQRQYEQAGRLYKMVTEKYPNSAYAAQAQGCLTKTGQVRNIIFGLIEAGDYAQVRPEVDKLIADFGDEADVPAILYHVASKLEEAGAYAEARYVYEQIVWRYPGDLQAENAKLDVRRTKVLSFYGMGDESGAKAELEKLVVDFNDNAHLPTAVMLTAEGCYRQGLKIDGQEEPNEFRAWINKTLGTLDVVVSRLGPSKEVPNALILAGECYEQSGQYDKAKASYARVADEYPDYERAWHALFMVGRCYEELGRTGGMSKSAATANARETYEQVAERYPGSQAARVAKNWLKEHRGN